MKKGIYLLLVSVLVFSLVLGIFGCTSQPAQPTAKPAPATTQPAAPTTKPAPATTAPPATTAAPATTYNFKFAGYYPPNSPQAQTGDEYFMKRLEELGKGRIKWQYFPSEQLGKGTEQVSIIGGGTAEFGALVPAFFTGKIPLLGSQDLPFLFSTDVAGHIRIAGALLHQPEITDAFAKEKVKIVSAASFGTMSAFFKKPLKTMEDWKGRKVRTAGKMQSDTLAALGATPQSLLSAEVYMALSTGVLDGSLWHPLSALEYKLYEVAKYAVIPYISISGYTTAQIMSLDFYNKLPKDVQDMINQAGLDTEKYAEKAFLEQEKTAIEDLAKKGVDVYMVPQQETLRWREASKPLWNDWLKANGAPGQKLLDFVLKELGEKK